MNGVMRIVVTSNLTFSRNNLRSSLCCTNFNCLGVGNCLLSEVLTVLLSIKVMYASGWQTLFGYIRNEGKFCLYQIFIVTNLFCFEAGR